MIVINLLPPQIKQKIENAKRSASLVSVALIVVIIIAVLAFLLWAAKSQYLEPTLAMTKSQIIKANNELVSYKKLEEAALFLNDRAKIASDIESKRPMWSQILRDLINSVPQTVQFTSLAGDLDKTPNFVLQGNTISEREIIKFKEKLENSAFFKDVAFKSSAAEKTTTPVPTTTSTTTTGTTPTTVPQTTSNKVIFSLEFNLEKLNLSQEKD